MVQLAHQLNLGYTQGEAAAHARAVTAALTCKLGADKRITLVQDLAHGGEPELVQHDLSTQKTASAISVL